MSSICMIVQGVYDSDPRVRRKAEALTAAGYSVDVLALRPDNSPASYGVNGVTVHTMSLGKKRGTLARYAFEYGMFFLWVFAKLPALMRRRRYAIVDVNTLPDFLIFAPIVARLMGARLILDMHEITPEFYISKFGIDRRSPIIHLLTTIERASYRFADRVLTISDPVEDLLVSRGLDRRKSTVVMNSADESRFGTVVSPEQRGASDAFVMIYHGTLTRIYGLDQAIEAFGLVHDRMPKAEMWILGSGPESSNLAQVAHKRGLAEKVKLIGQVPASEIPTWLGKSDIGLLPIRRDALLDFAFPNKLPEYIITGRAVIMSRLNAIAHYFSEGALAFAEPNNPADIARQMLRLYQNADLRRQLAAKAAEEYAPISWRVMKQRYVDLVGQIAAETRDGRAELAPTAVPASPDRAIRE